MGIVKPAFPALQRGQVVAQGLKAFWTFHEGSGFDIADAVGNCPGTLTDAIWRNTRYGYALEISPFGSTGGVTVPRRFDSLSVGNDWTVLARVFVISKANRYGLFSTRLTNPTGSWQVEVGPLSGNNDRFGVTGPGAFIIVSGTALSNNQWYHLAVTKSGTGAGDTAIYIDGLEDTPAVQNAFTCQDNQDDVLVGDGNTGEFHGQIAEMRLYDRALSSSDISRIAAGFG